MLFIKEFPKNADLTLKWDTNFKKYIIFEKYIDFSETNYLNDSARNTLFSF